MILENILLRSNKTARYISDKETDLFMKKYLEDKITEEINTNDKDVIVITICEKEYSLIRDQISIMFDNIKVPDCKFDFTILLLESVRRITSRYIDIFKIKYSMSCIGSCKITIGVNMKKIK